MKHHIHFVAVCKFAISQYVHMLISLSLPKGPGNREWFPFTIINRHLNLSKETVEKYLI